MSGELCVPGAAEESCRGRRWIGVVIFAAALAVRAGYLYDISDSPAFLTPTVDSRAYHDLALFFAAHKATDPGFFWQPLLYPLLLGVLYWLARPSILLATAAQLLLGCFTSVLTYRLGRRVFGQAAGIIAGLIAATYLPMIFFEAELLATGLAAFWSAALLLLFLGAQRQAGVRRAFVLGVCGALSVLTRPTFLPLAFFAAVWLLVVWRRRGQRWGAALSPVAAAVAGFCLIVLPAAWQNFRTTGDFAFLPGSGGINLYVGNNPQADKTLSARPGFQWSQIEAMPAWELGRESSYLERKEFFQRRAVQYMRSRPLSFLAGLGEKTLAFFSARELPRNDDVYVFRRWSPMLRAGVWKAGGFGFPFGVLLPLAVVGAVLGARKIPGIVWLFVVLMPAAVIVVFPAARYRAPLIPVFAVLAGGGAVALVDLARRRRWGRAALAVAAAVAVALAVSFPGPFAVEKTNYEAELYHLVAAERFHAGNMAQALDLAQRSVALEDNYADSHHLLGTILAAARRDAEAVAEFQRALQIEPGHYGGYYGLGEVYLAQGRRADAEAAYRRAMDLRPFSYLLRHKLGKVLQQQGRLDEAIDEYRQAVRLGPNRPELIRPLAWLLATAPDDDCRNGAEAVQLAERACELTKRRDPNDLICLAAACAEAGRWDEAVAAAQSAAALAAQGGDFGLAGRAESLARMFREHRPYRQRAAP